MNRLQQDAAEAMHWHEQYGRHRYPPRPMTPMGEPWRPTIPEQERQEREQQIAAGALPF